MAFTERVTATACVSSFLGACVGACFEGEEVACVDDASCEELAGKSSKRINKHCKDEDTAALCPALCGACERRLDSSPCFDSCSEHCEAVCWDLAGKPVLATPVPEEPVPATPAPEPVPATPVPEEPEEPEEACEDELDNCEEKASEDDGFCLTKKGKNKCKATCGKCRRLLMV